MNKQINESPEISSAVMCKTKNWVKVKFSTCLEHFLIKILGLFFFALAWVMQFRCAVPVWGVVGGRGWPEQDLVSSSIAFPCVRVSHWTKACCFGQVCWLTSKLWLLRLGLQICAAMLSLVPERWAFEPGSSGLHSHCSTQSVSHLPSPLGSDEKKSFKLCCSVIELWTFFPLIFF